jgi:hypothetical protein
LMNSIQLATDEIKEPYECALCRGTRYYAGCTNKTL